jgi:hypothetical protein
MVGWWYRVVGDLDVPCERETYSGFDDSKEEVGSRVSQIPGIDSLVVLKKETVYRSRSSGRYYWPLQQSLFARNVQGTACL